MYTVYKGRDNTFTIRLLENKVVQDLSAVTKVGVLYKGVLYDSATYPSSFDFVTGSIEGKIVIKLGIISSMPEGRDSRSEVFIYDPSNINGIFWGFLSLRVVTLS